MKLSKQERIGVLIILAVIILALGAFLIIKPKFESIGSKQATLISKQAQLAADKATAERKSGLRTDIEAAYQQGEHLADMFFPELTSYEADDAFRAFLKQCKSPVVVESLTVSEPNTSSLEVSFFTPESVEYALKTYVSQGIDSSDPNDLNSKRISALQAALANPETIGSSEVEFSVSALSYDDIMAFVDEVNNYLIKEGNDGEEIRKAISVNGISVPYEELNAIYDAYVTASTDSMEAIGEAALIEVLASKTDPSLRLPLSEAPAPLAPDMSEVEIPSYFTYTGTLRFYSIERMQNPKAILDEQDGIVNETPAA